MLLVLLAATNARAQIFSPGALSKPHDALDGIAQCTKCHLEGGKHDRGKCLECHKEIGVRVDAGTGYHSSTGVKSKECAECHREHRGANAKLVEWVPARDNFNHGLTGWPLIGKHKANKCNDCHETRRIDDSVIRALVTKKGRESYLGLSTRCADCHFDEHRAQEGNDCARCHTPEDFKKAPGFNHNDKKDARWPLLGKHKNVACKSCHESLTDTKTPPGVFPAPKDSTYLQLKDIPFAQCTACHDDPHRGSFGKSCDRCHTATGWMIIKEGAQDTGFHDKHAFKLRGEHQSVACKLCHGPFGSTPAKFKGLKFQKCADCHTDAHVGQLAPEEKGGVVKCETCHTVAGFTPVLFDVTMHDKTRFPLELSHRAVACTNCHKPDPRLRERVPAKVRADMERRGRRVIVSDARLEMPDIVADALDKTATKTAEETDCAGCHADVHDGQFAKAIGEGDSKVEKKGCARCHAQTSFTDLAKFNHDDSRFRLTGKHAKAQCNACHQKSSKRSRASDAIIYRGMEVDCASCHADEHVGQLAQAGHTDCAACHTTTDFKTEKFDHDKQSVFPLVGNHRRTKCVNCHALVTVGDQKIARYKPLPTTCGECHEDEHKGAFDAFDPMLDPTKVNVNVIEKDDDKKKKNKTGDQSETTEREPGASTRCDSCHTPDGWLTAKFAHERTGFALSGKHAVTRCASCHGNDQKRPLPATCIGCHRDPHAQEFGLMCSACHTTQIFAGPTFPVDAHRRTNFPLTGRHAALPCDQCHVERRERTFTRAALDCLACHRLDSIRASQVTVNHGIPPFSNKGCNTCHVPVTFAPARFPEHEKCFPLSRGVHAPIRCAECHTNLAGAIANGSCRGIPVLCAQCHAHDAEVEDPRHVNVPGYEHKSEKCAGCHRTP